VLFNIAAPAQAKYGGGTGGPNDPYLIFDANQMNAIGADSSDWDKHFKLMADIDLSAFTGTSFNIIGTGFWEYHPFDPVFVTTPFTGVFDGNNHKMRRLTELTTHNVPQTTNHELRTTSYEPRATNYEPRATSHELRTKMRAF